MNEDLRARLDEHFGPEKASGYDAGIRRRIPGYDTLHETAAELLAACLPERASVLVVGAGTGEELGRLAGLGRALRLVGVEPSKAMAQVARARLERAGVAQSIEIVRGLVDDLPITRSHDAATAILVSHFLPDDGPKAALFSQIAARLETGGALVTADFVGARGTEAFERTLAAWAGWRSRQGADASDVAGYFHRIRNEIHLVTEERYVSLLHEAGFLPVTRFYGAFLVQGWLWHKV